MKDQTARGRFFASSVAFGALAAALGAPQAYAQDAEVAEDEVIVVTGSRIATRDAEATSPIDTISGDDLREIGSANVETYLNALPQFSPALSRNNNNPQGGGAANLDLRQLGANRGLVLLDGRRMVPGRADGAVDISILPPALIERVEVITGGASATYGSDAVSGVVNFVLRDDFDGVELTAQTGMTTEYGDGQETTISATLGSNFDGGRGNAVFAGSWTQRDSIGQGARPFSAFATFIDQTGAFLNGSPTTPDGTLTGLINPGANTAISGGEFQDLQDALNVYFGLPANGGSAPDNVYLGAPGGGFGTVQFGGWLGWNPNGSLFGTGGALGGDQTVVNYQGPFGPENYDPSAYSSNFNPQNLLSLPVDRYNAFAHIDYDITDTVTMWGEFLFTNYTSVTNLASSPVNFINNNAINPNTMSDANKAALLGDWYDILLATGNYTDPDGAGPGGTFPRINLSYRFVPLGPRAGNFDTTAWQMSGGLRGEIEGATDTPWRWELFGSLGRYSQEVLYRGYPSISRALAAGRGCANAPGGPAPCAPANLFGFGNLSAEAAAYIEAPYFDNQSYEQRYVQGNITGDLLNLWAGPLSVAVGAEYRYVGYENNPDQALQSGDIGGANAKAPLFGEFDVYEIYGEFRLPVLADMPFAESLDIEGGYRISDYSSGAGRTETWKIGGTWSPTDWLRFRAQQQLAVRAPSIFELFLANAEGFPGIPGVNGGSDPCDFNSPERTGPNAAAITDLCEAQAPAVNFATFNSPNVGQYRTIGGGNQNLQAEEAETTTYGVVIEMPAAAPEWLQRFTMSVDWYNYEISGAVGAVDIELSLPRCYDPAFNPTFTNANAFCQALHRDPVNGLLTGVSDGFVSETLQNLATIQVEGVDIGASYGFGLGRWGDVELGLQASLLEGYAVSALPGDPLVDGVGTIGNGTPGRTALPEWKSTVNATWNVGPVSVGWRWVRIGEVTTGVPAPAISEIPAINYHFLNARWSINENIELFGGVDNVLDQDPPLYTAGFQFNTDPSTYDVMGRFAYAGARLRF